MKKIHVNLNEASQYLITLLVTLFFTTLVFHLWEVSLRFPLFSYGGDALSVSVGYKSIIETGWIFSNPSIGAPFGSIFLDYPNSDALNIFMGLILSFFTRDPMMIFNLYYLCGFPLSAIFALFALKKIKTPFYLALPGAIAFAFLPFHLLRYGHLFLASYYMIPLGLLAVWEAISGNLNVVTWNKENRRISVNLKQPKVWFYILICFLTASSGIYYAYFTAFVGFVSAVWCLFLEDVEDRLSRSVSCFILVSSLAITAIINGGPSYYYTIVNEISSEPAIVRSGAGAEIYGLKIIQMLLPSASHRFSQLAGITQRYSSTTPLVNENSTASLGFVGAIGFLYSLLFLFRQKRNNIIDDYLGFINISCVLLATIGGFSSVIAYFFLPNIRAYNRISVVIGFVSIAMFFRFVQYLVDIIKPSMLANNGKINAVFSAGLSLLLLGMVFVDQCYSPDFMGNYQQIKVMYENDKQFAHKIEETLPQGAMVFQLPFMPFPESGPINKMGDYDHFKPYVFTSGLRWSYGGAKGRKASDWNKATAKLPVEQMLQRLAAMGFSGIYIDRFGYQDAGVEIEANIHLYIELDPIVSKDQRFVFFDIREYVDAYRSGFSDEQWRLMSVLASKIESKIIPSRECSPVEGESGNQWIWCGDAGELVILNYDSVDRNVILNFDVATGTGEDAFLFVKTENWEEQFEINGTPQSVQLIVPIKAGIIAQKISLLSDAGSYNSANGDPRELVFVLYNPTVKSESTLVLP